MSKITLNNVGSLTEFTTAAAVINGNKAVIQTAFDNTLSRDGTSPNQMAASIDMNSNRVLNLPAAVTAHEPLRYQDLSDFVGGGTVTNIPAGGGSGDILTKHSSVDYDIEWNHVVLSVLPGTNIAVTGSSPATVSTIPNPNFTTSVTTPSLVLNGTTLNSKTGTGSIVLNTSPTLITPALGTPASGVATNLTGTASGLTAGNVTTNANLTGDVTSVGNATTLTNAPVIAKVLTGYTSGAGTISSSDSILSAIQKLNGNNATNANLTGPITSVGNATSIASQTGTGTKFVVDTSPTLVTPNLGTPSAVTLTNGTSLPIAGIASLGTGVATGLATNAGAVGSFVPYNGNAGTPSFLVLTNATGTAAGLTAGNVTTNANLTGDVTSVGNATTLTNAPVIAKVLTGYTSGAGTVSSTDSILSAIQKLNGNDATNANLTGVITSVGNATSIASQTGTGTKFVTDTSPTLVTPVLGAATATSLNGNTFTTGTYTLTGTAAKTLNFTNTITLSGTDSTTMTFPTTSATLARTDAANTFTGIQTFNTAVAVASGGTGDTGTAWTATTPTVSFLGAPGGSPAGTCNLYTKTIGKTVHIRGNVVITNVGSGPAATGFGFALPTSHIGTNTRGIYLGGYTSGDVPMAWLGLGGSTVAYATTTAGAQYTSTGTYYFNGIYESV